MSELRWKWVLYGSPVGAVVGYLLGLWAPEVMLTTGFIGSLFLNALRVITGPLIILSIVVAVTTLAGSRKIGRPSIVALIYFAATTAAAVVVALIMGLAFQPGIGIDVAGVTPPSFLNMFRTMTVDHFVASLIPSSVPGAVVQGNYIGLAVLSVVFGLILTRAGRSSKKVADLFSEFLQLISRVIEWLMVVVPIGVLFLVSRAVADTSFSGAELFGQLGKFTWVVVAAMGIHAIVLLPLALKMMTRQNILGTAGQMMPAFAAAFSTQSTTSALPVTLDCAVNRCHFDRRAGNFVLPLGAVFNVGATAMYAVLGTLFVAQAFAVPLSIPQILLIGLIAVALSFGVASIPYSTMFIMFVLFGISGFPSQAYAGLGLIMIVDWLLDRVRSVVNVWSDVVGTAVVSESFDSRPSTRKSSSRSGNDRTTTGRGQTRQPRRSSTSTGRGDRPQRGRYGDRSGSSSSDNSRRQRPTSGSHGERSPFEITRGESQLVDLETPATPDRDSGDARSSRRDRPGGSGRGRSDSQVSRRELPRNGNRRNGRGSDRDRKYPDNKPAESGTKPTYTLPPPPPLPVMEKKRPEPEKSEIPSPKPDRITEDKTERIKSDAPVNEQTKVDWGEELEDVSVTPSAADDEVSESDQEPPEDRTDDKEEDDKHPEDEAPEEDGKQDEPNYGRRSSHRQKPKRDDDGDSDQDKEPLDEVAYSSEGQSFGRARKKRTR